MKQISDCCTKKGLIKDKYIVCKNCGQVEGPIYIMPWVEFKTENYTCKSIYQRKYYIDEIIRELKIEYNIKDKVYKIFKTIEPIFYKVNDNLQRKRIIHLKFIISKILSLLSIDYKVNIKPKTLPFNEKYWDEIYKLKSEEIQQIIKD